MARRKIKGPLGPPIGLLSSFGLACALLACLWVLVLAATFRYKYVGELGVKREFFIPWIVYFNWLPFPGGKTIFSLLALNLLVGGLLRIRWAWRTAGIIVAHFGIVGLVLAGVVNYSRAVYGHVAMEEGEVADQYQSYSYWELAVWNAGQISDVQEWLVGESDLHALHDRGRTFSNPEVPFQLELSGWVANCDPQPKGPMWKAASPVVEGWALRELPTADGAEKNFPGLVARVTRPDGSVAQALLWGRSIYPWTVRVGDELWAISLRHERYFLPFELRLVDFHKEEHPGTSMARTYRSDVVKVEAGHEQQVRISMNQPLRSQNHVVYQSGWGETRRGLYTDLAVAHNPSDQWPKWSCWVVGIGLLMAFLHRLIQYAVIQARQRAASSNTPG